jgi:hypothetical protein
MVIALSCRKGTYLRRGEGKMIRRITDKVTDLQLASISPVHTEGLEPPVVVCTPKLWNFFLVVTSGVKR